MTATSEKSLIRFSASGWKAWALVFSLVLTACGKQGGSDASSSGANGAPSVLSYSANPAYYNLGTAITANIASADKQVNSWSISQALPTGLTFDSSSGKITGTPTVSSATTTYTVTATNSYGSNFVRLVLGTGNVGSISYGGALSFQTGTSVGTVSPTVTGGYVSSCTISPAIPSGLSFDATNCNITGTPTSNVPVSGNWTITPSYGSPTAVAGTPLIESISVTPNAPSITYPSGGNLTFYQNISVGTITPTVTNGPVTSCSVTPSLPAGLTLNTSTCVITGTPTATQALTAYTVTPGNVHGTSNYGFTITITNPPPSLTYTPNTQTGTYGTAITTMTPTNSGGQITGCASAPLLSGIGLTLNTSTCAISGTPTAIGGPTVYTITPTGGAGVTVTLTIGDALPAMTFSGSPYTFTDNSAITPINATRTAGSTITSCTTGGLPAGLSVNAVGGTCQITGTPTTPSALTSYTITPNNSAGAGTPVTIQIQVNEQLPHISFAGSPFNFTLNSSVGTISSTNTGGGNFSSCLASPALPGGLTLSYAGTPSVCQITGTPNAAQAATNYNITATNSAGSYTTTVSIAVSTGGAPNIAFSPSTVTWNAGSTAVNIAVGSGMTNTGGVISSCAISPSPPGGIGFNTSTCALTGTPSAGIGQAATNYSVTATNASGTSTASLSIAIITVPVISYPGSPYTFTKGTAISTVTPTNTGSAATACTSGTWGPAGLTLNADCSITGTPTGTQAQTTYTIANSNADGSGVNATVKITVNNTPPTISVSPANYTFNKSVAITNITPTLGGGTPTSCTTTPSLAGTGLSINNVTCVISGTPTTSFSSQAYTITASNNGGSATANINIAINDTVPSLSYAGTPFTWTAGTSIGTINPTSTGGAITSCSASPTLPAGISLTTACVLSGTPTAGQNATSYTISATNTGGTATTSVSIAVNTLPIISYPGSPYVYTKGTAITALNPSNAGYGAMTGCAISPNLNTNTGLTFNTTSCQISGTPTTLSGAVVYTVTPTNAVGTGSAATVSITVNDAVPSIGYSPSSYTETVNSLISTITPSSTGGAPVTCATSPALPTGLSISNTTCAISGTPTVTSLATAYTVTATNTGGSATATVNLTVKNSPQIVFYSKQAVGGVASSSFNVWQTDINGLNQTHLTSNTASSLDSVFPSFIGTGGTVVFGSLMNIGATSVSSYNLWKMDASTAVPVNGGTNQTYLTGNTAGAADVYDSVADGIAPCTVMTTPITLGNCLPVYSPDGTKIAFASKQNITGVADSGAESCYNIFIMNANGTGVTALTQNTGNSTHCGDSVSPVFSPDGTKIYFTSKQNLANTTSTWSGPNNSNFNIWSISTSGSSMTNLTSLNNSGQDSAQPTVSPDGTLIAFTSAIKISGSNASTNIWTMKSDGTNQNSLTGNNTRSGADSKDPVFSPDGTEIAFASKQNSGTTSTTWNVTNPSLSFNIWKMGYTGTNLVQLTTNNSTVTSGFDSSAPSWSPDSSYIAFRSKQSTDLVGPLACYNIWVMKQDGSSSNYLTDNNTAGKDSYLSPYNNVWYKP